MTHAQAAVRAADLRREIHRHNELYFVQAAPEISDREYDLLFRELEAIEKAYPDLRTPDSPTRRVGGEPLAAFRSVRHAVPMMSLSNTYARNELLDFDARLKRLVPHAVLQYVLEPKIDGVAVAVRYLDGVLNVGSTRGNGVFGDDITSNLQTLRTVPLRLQGNGIPGVLDVRGEVFMTREGFARLNREREEAGLPPFANPRNAAAGSLKLLDSRVVAKRPLEAVFYGVAEASALPLPSHEALIAALRRFGFRTPPVAWRCASIHEVIARLDELREKRHDFAFDIDGAVVKVNDRALYDVLGATARSPRWAVAFKYEPEQAETRIQAIRVQVGRTGVLTPVAEFDPVVVAGSEIRRATLHNMDEIRRRDMRVGDRVVVEKAGDVIPAIIDVRKDRRTGSEAPFQMPKRCPVCRGPLSRRESEVALRCENLQCPAQIKRWIRHFASRNAMDIEGLGDALIEQLVDTGLVRDPADLYTLDENRIAGLERMGPRSAAKLLQGIRNSRTRELASLIYALGIRHVGARTAQLLAEAFGCLENLVDADRERLESVRDVGPVAADSIAAFFASERIRALIARLFGAGLQPRKPEGASRRGGLLSGKTFVLTGTLRHFTREQAAERIRFLGGRVASGVSRKTDWLVVGDSPGSKRTKAERLGVAVLDETAFRNLTEA